MRLKIRCDGKCEKFCKIFRELNKASIGWSLVGFRVPMHFLHANHADGDRPPATSGTGRACACAAPGTQMLVVVVAVAGGESRRVVSCTRVSAALRLHAPAVHSLCGAVLCACVSTAVRPGSTVCPQRSGQACERTRSSSRNFTRFFVASNFTTHI